MHSNSDILAYCLKRSWLNLEQVQSVQTLSSTLPNSSVCDLLAEQQMLSNHQLEELRAWHGTRSESKLINWLIHASIIAGRRDLWIEAGQPVRISTRGEVQTIESNSIHLEEIKTLIQSFLTPGMWNQLIEKSKISFVYAIESIGRYRISIESTHSTFKLHARILPYNPPSLDQLGLNTESVESIQKIKQGIIWITGPSGSGLSTTLASFIDYFQIHQKGQILCYQTFTEYLGKMHGLPMISHATSLMPHNWTQSIKSEIICPTIDILAFDTPLDANLLAAVLQAVHGGKLALICLPQSTSEQAFTQIIRLFNPTQRAHVQALLATQSQAVIAQSWNNLNENDASQAASAHPHFELYLATPQNREALRTGQFEKLISTAHAF